MLCSRQLPIITLLAALFALPAPPAFAAGEDDDDKPNPDRFEISALPVLLGDTDRGIILGAYGVVVRFRKNYAPYRWRLRIATQMSVERREDDTLQLPFHDHYVHLDVPGFLHPRLRFDMEVAFRRYADTGYFGVGNASPDTPMNSVHAFNEYGRTNPSVSLLGRWRFPHGIALLFGAEFTYNWLQISQDSKLDQDLRAGDQRLDDLLHGVEDHALLTAVVGWLWDTRDHEFAPTRGMFHEISWRFSPGLSFLFAGLDVTSRFYYAVFGDKLVLAARITLDMLFGDAPVYELARLGGLEAQPGIGGARGVRGVPLQRYSGKIKLMGNLEARSKLLPFSILSQRFNLGLLAFVDLGRIWSDYRGETRFDGDSVGIKVGVGGGFRLQWGETFILRGDIAWSPDADPVGAYFGFQHIF